MTSPEDMRPPEEIVALFETDHPFTEEEIAHSLGRAAWMSVRLSAEFTLTLFELGIDESKIPAVVEAFGECQEDFMDFVRVGLGATRETEREEHPLEDPLYEVVADLMDAIDIVNDVGLLDSHLFKGGDNQMRDFGIMSEEELLHRLNAHAHRIESKSSD